MNRLTKRTQKGAALKLDNSKTEKEARKQLHDKYLLAIEKLAAYEDTGLTPEEIMDRKMLTGWIPCSERLPEEHDTMFAKYLGTNKWVDAMFAKQSDDVNVTVQYEDGTRRTVTMHTNDGEWVYEHEILKPKAIAWQPLPEPWEGEIDEIH